MNPMRRIARIAIRALAQSLGVYVENRLGAGNMMIFIVERGGGFM
jgi:hypothetical protein